MNKQHPDGGRRSGLKPPETMGDMYRYFKRAVRTLMHFRRVRGVPRGTDA